MNIETVNRALRDVERELTRFGFYTTKTQATEVFLHPFLLLFPTVEGLYWPAKPMFGYRVGICPVCLEDPAAPSVKCSGMSLATRYLPGITVHSKSCASQGASVGPTSAVSATIAGLRPMRERLRRRILAKPLQRS